MRVLRQTLSPSTRWVEGHAFCRPAWPEQGSTETGSSYIALPSPGDLSGPDPAQPWNLILGLSAQGAPAACTMLASGFELIFGPQRVVHAVMAQPGILVGHASFEMTPSLFAPEHEVHRTGVCDWLDTKPLVVLMTRTGSGTTRFCLASKPGAPEAVSRLARECLDIDAAHLFEEEREARAALWDRARDVGDLGPMLGPAVETLVAAVRPPTAVLPFRWSASSGADTDSFRINDVFPLVQAWSEIDPAVAEDMVRAALACQRADGFVPAVCSAGSPRVSPEAAWPLLTRSALTAWETRHDPRFLDHVMPQLHLYLSRAIAYFDPDHDGIPCWQSQNEAFIPHTYDPLVATADLTTFLLSEIQAFLELAEAADFAFDPAPFKSQRNRLCATLETLLWSPQTRRFPDRYLGGGPIERVTLSSVIPLFWEVLPGRFRENPINLLADSKSFLTPQGISLWLSWDSDESPAPVLLPHQTIALTALNRAGADAERRRVAGTLTRRLSELFRRDGVIPVRIDNAPPAEPGSEESGEPVLAAALTVVLSGINDEQAATSGMPAPVRWMDRHRFAVIGTSIAAMALAVIGITVAYFFKKTMPGGSSEPLAGIARQHYVEGHYDEAATIYEDLLEGTDGAVSVEFLLGNACLNKGDFVAAETHYRNVLKSSPRAPTVLMNLGLALFRQGRLREAGECYATVIHAFGPARPDLAQKAKTALQIINARMAQDGPSR